MPRTQAGMPALPYHAFDNVNRLEHLYVEPPVTQRVSCAEGRQLRPLISTYYQRWKTGNSFTGSSGRGRGVFLRASPIDVSGLFAGQTL